MAIQLSENTAASVQAEITATELRIDDIHARLCLSDTDGLSRLRTELRDAESDLSFLGTLHEQLDSQEQATRVAEAEATKAREILVASRATKAIQTKFVNKCKKFDQQVKDLSANLEEIYAFAFKEHGSDGQAKVSGALHRVMSMQIPQLGLERHPNATMKDTSLHQLLEALTCLDEPAD